MVLTDKQFYKAALNLGIEELKKQRKPILQVMLPARQKILRPT